MSRYGCLNGWAKALCSEVGRIGQLVPCSGSFLLAKHQAGWIDSRWDAQEAGPPPQFLGSDAFMRGDYEAQKNGRFI